jgi:hypothetical protein
MVNVDARAPTPGQGDTEARPNAEPSVNRMSVRAIAAIVPAMIDDQDMAEPPEPVGIPAG